MAMPEFIDDDETPASNAGSAGPKFVDDSPEDEKKLSDWQARGIVGEGRKYLGQQDDGSEAFEYDAEHAPAFAPQDDEGKAMHERVKAYKGGNLSHFDRPMQIQRDENGKATGYATTKSTVVGELDGTWSVIPTIWRDSRDGAVLEAIDDADAAAYYRENGEKRYGNFPTKEEAVAASKEIHELHQRAYGQKWNQWINEHWDEVSDEIKNAQGVKEAHEAWEKAGKPGIRFTANFPEDKPSEPTENMGVLEHGQKTLQAETGKEYTKGMAALLNIAPFGRQVEKYEGNRRTADLERLRVGDYDDAEMDELAKRLGFAEDARTLSGGNREQMKNVLSEMAESELLSTTRSKKEASAEIEAKPLTTWGKVASGTIENAGYVNGFIYGSVMLPSVSVGGGALAKIGAGAANSAIGGLPTAIVGGMERASGFANKSYDIDELGELKVVNDNYDKLTAAFKGGAGSVVENIVVEGLTDEAISLGLLGFSKIPGVSALVRGISKGAMKSGAGRALVRVGNFYNKYGQYTQFHSIPVEQFEEIVQPVFDDVLGLGKRSGEKTDTFGEYASKMFSSENQMDIFLGLVGTMLVQGGAAAVNAGVSARSKEGRRVAQDVREARSILVDAKADSKMVAALSDKEAVDTANAYLAMVQNPAAAEEFAKNLSDRSDIVFEQLYGMAESKMNADLEAMNIAPRKFTIPTREVDGRLKPDFQNQVVVNSVTGESKEAVQVVDQDTGIGIIDNGVENKYAPFTVYDPVFGISLDANNLMQAKQRADMLMANRQLYMAQDDIKKSLIAEEAERNYGNAKIYDARTIDEAIKFSQQLGFDPVKAGGFRTDRAGWRLEDGTVVLVRDNIRTPYKLRTLLRHENIGHSEELMQQPWLDAEGDIGETREGNLQNVMEPGPQGKGEMERVLRESVANTVQKRIHSPTRGEKISHAIRQGLRKVGFDLKMNDADLEVAAAKVEQAMREGRDGVHESAPILESAFEVSAAEPRETPAEAAGAHGEGEAGNEPSKTTEAPTGVPGASGEAPRRLTSAEEAISTAKTPFNAAEKAALEGAADVSGIDATDEMPEQRDYLSILSKDAPVVRLNPAKVDRSDAILPNMKKDANRVSGITKPLSGEWHPTMGGIGAAWLTKDGKLVVITGRHRSELAERKGKSMLYYLYREADGFTKDNALIYDAVANIHDEKGTINDYLGFLDKINPTREQADKAGILAGKGLVAWSLYKDATEAVRSATAMDGNPGEGQISPQQATVIAEAAPRDADKRNPSIQRQLLKTALGGMKGKAFDMYARIRAEELSKTPVNENLLVGEQMDLFSSPEDQAADILAQRQSQYRTKKANGYGEVARNLRTALNGEGKLELNDEYAKELGVTDKTDRKQLEAAYDKAVERANYWENTVRLDEADKTAMDAEINATADARAKRLQELKAKREAAKSGKPKVVVSKTETTTPAPKKDEKPTEQKPQDLPKTAKDARKFLEENKGRKFTTAKDKGVRAMLNGLTTMNDGTIVASVLIDGAESTIGVSGAISRIARGEWVLDDAQPPKSAPVSAPAKNRGTAPAKPKKPTEAKETASGAKPAVWPEGWDNAGEEIKGYVAPKGDDIQPRREVAIAHRSGGSINAPQKIKGVVETVDGDNVKVYYKDGMGYDQHDTFKKSEIVGVMPLSTKPAAKPKREPSIKMKDEAAEKLAQQQEDDLAALFDTPELDVKDAGENEAKYLSWAKRWKLDPSKKKNQREWAERNGVSFDTPEFDPDIFQKRVGAVAKLVKTYQDNGVADFKTLATRMAERFPEKFATMKPYLRGVWNAVADQMKLSDVSRDDAERIYGIIQPQAKEATNGPGEHGENGGVRAPANGGERPGGILAGGQVRAESPDERVGSVGAGSVPGQHVRVAEAGTPQEQPAGGGAAAGGNGAVADRPEHEGGEREAGGDSPDDGEKPRTRVKKTSKKAADKTKVNPSRRDFVMTKAVEDAILEKKTAQRVRNNLDAIKLIRDLKARDYVATPDEQATLAKFVGWGGLREDVFGYDLERAYDMERSGDAEGARRLLRREGVSQNVYELHKELRQVLNDNEYESAKASASTAFYTPIDFVRVLHDALRKLGVKGGRFLGPSAGTGNFASAAGEYEKPVNWQFVEKDAMTGEMLKALFPNQRVNIGGFEETKFPDGFFDFAIDNVPYADVPISDRSLSSKMFKIHDYFFAKTLAKLRPGGVMAFLTSTGTLDKTSPILRQFLTEHGGKIVGAVRLPNGFFAENAGTDVASDLVIVQKVDGRPDNSAFERGEQYGTTTEWVRRKGNVQKPLTYNGYFKDNPGQVIGKMEVASGQFGPTLKYTMPEGDMLTSIGGAIERALDGIDKDALLKTATVAEVQDHAPVYDDEGLRQGNVTMKDGKPFIKSGDMLEPISLPSDRALTKELAKRFKSAKSIMDGLIDLRKAMREVIDAQMADSDVAETDLTPLLAKLNEVYDAFVKKNGALHDKWVSPFVLLDKADGNRMLALERVVKDENGKPKIVKSDIFTKRVISRGQRASKADTPKDALVISYSETGAINVPRIAELLGVDADEAVARLKESGDAFENPQTGRLEPSWTYLSGRVRAKLAAARAAVEAGEESYRANIEALEKVQPPMVRLEDAEIKFGATWVDTDCMKDFLRDAFGSDSMRIGLGKNEVTGQWNVEFGRVMNEDPWGETSWSPVEFVSRVLNHGSMNHYDTDPVDKKRYLNERKTEANKLAAEKMHHAFSQFIQSSEKWAEPCYERYNAVMTDMVEIKLPNNVLPFRASGMTEATLAKLFEDGDPNRPKKGREYQSAVIARGVLGGSSLCLAHCVGAGKTLEMQSIGILGRHLGMFKKPMYVVPNHMLEQFTNEFVEAFPNANILKMSEDDVKPENRRAFFAQVANGDWDAIVVKHSTFSKKLGMSSKYQQMFLQGQLHELMDAIEAMREAGEKISVDQANKKKERLEAKLEQLANEENHDSQIVPFEELGVDQLFVDEAHNFKGMPITTSQGRTGGLSQGDSQRAVDMQMKTEYVQSLHGGDRGVVFATGTPLSNAPVVEAYVILKYLAPNKLEEQGLKHFDDFVSAFGRITTESEFSLDGKTVKEKEKVSAFVNIPELMKLLRSVIDIVNPDQLDIPRPKPKYHMIDVDMTPAQEAIMEMVAREAAKPPTREERNKYLTLTRIAKNACLTPRLLGFEDGGNKVIRAVSEIKKVYDETADNRGAQLVFTDIFNRAGGGTDAYINAHLSSETDFLRSEREYNLNEEIRDLLVAAGIPKDEIAIIQDIDKSKGDKDANKSALFAKVRSGEVRVLIGSRPKMGEGTNVQERLAAIHLLHPGWKPAEDEQAIGRIIRFGNTYKEGQIFYYLTKGNANIGSYETKNHQLIGVKSKLIDQVMHGDDTVREIDMDESAMDRDMLMGLASGNKALMELIDVKKRVHKLELNTESTASSARRIKDKAEANARVLERRREEFAKEQEGVKEWREKNEGKPFALSTPDGSTIDKVKDMADYVSAQMVKQLTKDSYDRDARTVLGDFNGVELVLAYDKYGDEKFRLAVPLLGVAREINYSGFIPDFSQAAMTAFKGRIFETVSPDFAKAYENSLADMDRQAKKMSSDADKLQKDYEGMREELIKLRTRQSELERAVTPLVVQAVADRKTAAYGNWTITKPTGSASYVAQRETDAKRLTAKTVKELIPLMDAEDFASPMNAAIKTIELRPRLKPNSKGEHPAVDTMSVAQVDFDTPSLSNAWNDSIPGEEAYNDGRLISGRGSFYSGASLNAIGAAGNGQIPLQALYAMFGARGGHKDFLRRLFTDPDKPTEWHHIGKKANEVLFTDRDEYNTPITDVTIFAGMNYKPVSEEELNRVVKVEKDASERLGEIANRIRTENTRTERRVEQRRVADPDIQREHQAIKSEMRKKYLRVPKEEWNALRARRNELAEKLYHYEDTVVERTVVPSGRELNELLRNDADAMRIIETAQRDILAAFGRKSPVSKTLDADAAFNKVVSLVNDVRARSVQFDTPELTPAEEAYGEAEDKTPTEKVMREVYGMTNEEIATALKAAGMEPPAHVRKPDETAWKQAEALLSNPSYMAKLSRAVAKFPRNIADYENNALNVLFRQRQAAVNAAQAVVDGLKETLDAFNAIPKEERDSDFGAEQQKTAKDYNEAKAKLAQAKSLMYETGLALTRSSSEAGRRLRSNRGLIDQTDYSYAGISGEVAAILGGADKITPEMDAKIREIAGEFASLDEQGRDLATARLKAQAEKIVEQIKNGDKVRKAAERKQGDEARRVMRNYNDALAQIEVGAAEVGGTLVGLSDQQYPAWGKWLRAIGEYHCFANPDITEEECIKAIVEDISPFMDGVDENQVRDALTGFGHNFRQSRYDSQRLMNDLRSQSRLKRQLDWMDETNTMPPLTGLVRDELSDTTRNLQKRVQERKMEVPDAGRDERRLKGVLESAKTRVKNRIADLENAIATGEKIPGRDRTVPEDIELRALKQRKDELQKTYDELFKTESGMTDEQRVKLAERLLGRELEHALEDLDRARSGDFSKRQKRPGAESPTIDALRERLADVRAQIRELKLAKYEFGMTPEELSAYNARKMANREKALARLAERIVSGDIRPQKKPQPPMPPDMKDRYDALGEQMNRAHRKLADLRREAADARKPAFIRFIGDAYRFVDGVWKMATASLDFTQVGNQTGSILMAHPKIVAENFAKTISAFASTTNAENIELDLLSEPSVKEAVENGWLRWKKISDASGRGERVELFDAIDKPFTVGGKALRFTDIPFYGKAIANSDRLYATYINAASASLYSTIVNDPKLFPGGATVFQKKMLCDMINVMNGSGTLSKGTRRVAGRILWAPGLVDSQLKRLLGYQIWHPWTASSEEDGSGTFKERAQMSRIGLGEFVRSNLGALLLGGLLFSLFATDDQKDEFGNAGIVKRVQMLVAPRIRHTQLDFTGGSVAFLRLFNRLVSGAYETATGKTVKTKDTFGEIAHFAKGRLTPLVSNFFSWLSGKDYTGQDFGAAELLLSFAPISLREAGKSIYENGIEDRAWGTAFLGAFLTMFGVGKGTYRKDDYKVLSNRFLESKKEFDTIEADELLDESNRKALLDSIRSDNPLMRDAVREDIAADIAQIRKDEARVRRDEKEGFEPDASLLFEIEQEKAALIEKIRAARSE